MTYLKNVFSLKRTRQSQPISGTSQVPNSAGGYAFPVDDWMRLDRFLILGSEGGSYYASEQKLTLQNAEAVVRCIGLDGLRVDVAARRIARHGLRRVDLLAGDEAACEHEDFVGPARRAFENLVEQVVR